MILEVTYDAVVNAAYIYLSRGHAKYTEEIDDLTYVDIGMSDRPKGIEVLNPRRSWPLDEIFARFPELKDDRTALEGLQWRTRWVDTFVKS